jgi:hypothetical protein
MPDTNGDADPETRKRCSQRKGTGYVTKRDLSSLRSHVTVLAPDDDEPADPEVKERCRRRKGTGYVTKEDLKSLQPRVTILEPDAADEGCDEPAPKRKGRRPTGALTKEQLLAALQREEEDDEDVSTMEAGDSDTDAPQRTTAWWDLRQPSADRSSSAEQDAAKPRVCFAAEEAPDFPAILTAPRRRSRRGTGVVTKEQLLEVVLNEGEDKHVSITADPLATFEVEEEPTDVPWKRSAGRQSTGFVPVKVLDEDDDEAPLTSWMCCGYKLK